MQPESDQSYSLATLIVFSCCACVIGLFLGGVTVAILTQKRIEKVAERVEVPVESQAKVETVNEQAAEPEANAEESSGQQFHFDRNPILDRIGRVKEFNNDELSKFLFGVGYAEIGGSTTKWKEIEWKREVLGMTGSQRVSAKNITDAHTNQRYKDAKLFEQQYLLICDQISEVHPELKFPKVYFHHDGIDVIVECTTSQRDYVRSLEAGDFVEILGFHSSISSIFETMGRKQITLFAGQQAPWEIYQFD